MGEGSSARSASQEAQPDRITLTAFSTLVLIGGLNFPAVKATVEELAPMWSAGVRFSAAALLLLAVATFLRQPVPRGRALGGIALYGALSFGAFYAFAYWGIQRLPAGVSSVVLASAPLLTFLAAVMHGLEAFRWQTLAGALLAIGGIALMAGGGDGGAFPILAVAALVFAGVCAAEAAVVAKKFPPISPLVMNAFGMVVGGVILLGLSFMAGESHVAPTRSTTWLGLAYLVLFGSIGLFGIYLFVLRRWTASGTSYAFVLFPVIAVLFASLFQGERITTGLVAGGVLVLTGVYVGALLQVGKKPQKAAEPPPEHVSVMAAATEEERPEMAGVPADCIRCP